MPLVVLAQDEALELRAEMAGYPLWQRRHDRFARGRQPALAPVKDRPWLYDNVLNDEVLVALEAGGRRQVVRLADPSFVYAELRPLGAAPALPAAAFGSGCLRRLLHAAGLELRAALQALEPRDLLAQLRVLCLQPGVLLQSLQQQRLQLFEASHGNVLR